MLTLVAGIDDDGATVADSPSPLLQMAPKAGGLPPGGHSTYKPFAPAPKGHCGLHPCTGDGPTLFPPATVVPHDSEYHTCDAPASDPRIAAPVDQVRPAHTCVAPPVAPVAPDIDQSSLQDRNIITVSCVGRDGSTRRMDEPALSVNVMKRIRERGKVIAFFVDGNGWLWCNIATEKQATRMMERLDNVLIESGSVRLTCQQTRMCDWPPGLCPEGDRTVPKAPPHHQRHRAGTRTLKGGARHRGATASGSAATVDEPSSSSRVPPTPPPPPQRWP